ncbi:hypothetical protein TWF679_009178 [Orbilia oligospora]|uniref:Uncharacterized protein n=1 Tax=Orbilia oligospora TaxID=2813651 RepID=A0A8H8V3H0_ORBOL|nr:hypothetical protein TWF679_009178 [Orbilia oligospora]
MAHVLKYKDDDNLSLSPTENLAREGKLLERARPYAVAVIGWIFAVNEENRQSCCVGLVLERGNPLDTRIDFDSGLPVDEKMEKEDKEEWQMKGTPMYESPNRYHGTHTYKAPVVEMDDLYALTLMVYQIYVPGNPSDFELVNEKFCPELAPHADFYAASYVVALIESPSTEVPDEYQASRANAIILHSINSILPYAQLFKMSSSDAVAINVYILGNKTVVTVANNPNVTGKSFTESADAFKRIVCSIRRIQELLTGISGSGTNAAEARTTFSALPVSPIFKADDFSDYEHAIFASLIRSHTGFHKRVDNDGEFVEAWLAECQRRLIEFGGGFRATETESTRVLGQGLGAMTLDDSPAKGKENRQGLCMEANLSQQEGADTTME